MSVCACGPWARPPAPSGFWLLGAEPGDDGCDGGGPPPGIAIADSDSADDVGVTRFPANDDPVDDVLEPEPALVGADASLRVFLLYGVVYGSSSSSSSSSLSSPGPAYLPMLLLPLLLLLLLVLPPRLPLVAMVVQL